MRERQTGNRNPQNLRGEGGGGGTSQRGRKSGNLEPKEPRRSGKAAGLRGLRPALQVAANSGYLAATTSEATTGFAVSSTAPAGDILSASRRRSLPRSSRFMSTISKDMPCPR